MKYILIIFLFYSTSVSAETCKWWFQRYGWKNFNLSKVEDCLKNGSPVIADVEGGESPLHIAAEVNNDPEVLLRLIRAGAEINGKTRKGWTPLHSAAANIDSKTNSGKTFIYWMEKNSKLKNTIGYIELLNLYDRSK